MSIETKKLSKDISYIFWRDGYTLATAESCTAGNIAAVITSIPGSSRFYKGGIVAYTDEVKTNLLGVDPEIIKEHGVVSEEVAIAMVKGAMKALNADCAVATTGIAGPGGGTHENHVGTIWIAVGLQEKVVTIKLTEDNGREMNISNATSKALQQLLELCESEEKEEENEN